MEDKQIPNKNQQPNDIIFPEDYIPPVFTISPNDVMLDDYNPWNLFVSKLKKLGLIYIGIQSIVIIMAVKAYPEAAGFVFGWSLVGIPFFIGAFIFGLVIRFFNKKHERNQQETLLTSRYTSPVLPQYFSFGFKLGLAGLTISVVVGVLGFVFDVLPLTMATIAFASLSLYYSVGHLVKTFFLLHVKK